MPKRGSRGERSCKQKCLEVVRVNWVSEGHSSSPQMSVAAVGEFSLPSASETLLLQYSCEAGTHTGEHRRARLSRSTWGWSTTLQRREQSPNAAIHLLIVVHLLYFFS